jgi:hypothetical protein
MVYLLFGPLLQRSNTVVFNGPYSAPVVKHYLRMLSEYIDQRALGRLRDCQYNVLVERHHDLLR